MLFFQISEVFWKDVKYFPTNNLYCNVQRFVSFVSHIGKVRYGERNAGNAGNAKNVHYDSGECSHFSTSENAQEDSGECSRRFRRMFKKIPGNAISVLGNVWKDSGECSGKLQGMLSILKLTKTTFYLEKVHVK